MIVEMDIEGPNPLTLERIIYHESWDALESFGLQTHDPGLVFYEHVLIQSLQ